MRVTIHQAVDMMACHGFLPCKLRRRTFTFDLPAHEFSLLRGTWLNSLVDSYQHGLNMHKLIKEATASASPTLLKRTHLRRLLSNRYEAYSKLSPISNDSHYRPANSHLKKQQLVDDHFSANNPCLEINLAWQSLGISIAICTYDVASAKLLGIAAGLLVSLGCKAVTTRYLTVLCRA